MISDEATLIRVWKGSERSRLQPDQLFQARRLRHPRHSRWGRARRRGYRDISIAGRDAKIIDGHTRLGVAAGDHSVIIWPLLCGLAKARYYLLTNEPLTGEEAERIGLVARCSPTRRSIQRPWVSPKSCPRNSSTAIRWTKHALNNWLRLAGPSFDTSLALEFLGFKLSDAKAGLEAIRNARKTRPDPSALNPANALRRSPLPPRHPKRIVPG